MATARMALRGIMDATVSLTTATTPTITALDDVAAVLGSYSREMREERLAEEAINKASLIDRVLENKAMEVVERRQSIVRWIGSDKEKSDMYQTAIEELKERLPKAA